MTILKPEVKKIFIRIHKEDGSYLKCYFKINSPIKKLMRAYCLKAHVPSVRFRYEGVTLRGTDTPISLEMEYGDVIDAHNC